MEPIRLSPQPPAAHGGAGSGIDLSASLNPLGPSPIALAEARAARLDRYPEPDAGLLRRSAAQLHAVPEGAVVAVPGAGFGLWLLMVVLLGRADRCLALGPCFGEYRRSAAIAEAAYQELRAEPPEFEWDLERAGPALAGARLCVLGNPANPSGTSIPAVRLRDLCRKHPATVFVVDEAFAAFSSPGTSLLEDGELPENAIVVRSLTKALGLPGLRMGYLVARPELASRIAGIMPAWPLSSASIAAAVAGLSDRQHVVEGAQLARAHIHLLEGALRSRGLEPVPSDANYLLVEAPGAAAALAQLGITVRDCSSFGLPGYVRIAAPSPADLSAVLDAIEKLPARVNAEIQPVPGTNRELAPEALRQRLTGQERTEDG
jgi:histidinol-phosphate aminotransferase